MCEKGGKIMAENITFVTIDLNRKQVNTDNPVHNDKTGKDYVQYRESKWCSGNY